MVRGIAGRLSLGAGGGAIIVTTFAGLASDLRRLGLRDGDVVCLHVSMKSLGYVLGGARTVIDAVLEVIGRGTLMMPAFSGDLSDPAEWQHPPVPADRLEEIRAQIPPFDPTRTPTRGVGAVAEYFRGYPGVLRSEHPQSSFCALGPLAAHLLARHPLADRFSMASPLGRFLDLDGRVLLLGAPRNTATALYLAEYGHKPVIQRSYCTGTGWEPGRDVEISDAHMAPTIEALLKQGLARRAKIGQGESILFSLEEAMLYLRPRQA